MQQKYDRVNADCQQLLKEKKEIAEKYDDVVSKYNILEKQ